VLCLETETPGRHSLRFVQAIRKGREETLAGLASHHAIDWLATLSGNGLNKSDDEGYAHISI